MPVICPPLIPTGGVVADTGLYGFEGPLVPDKADDFYLLTFNNGDNPGHYHWIVGAGRGDAVQSNLFDPRDWVAPGHTRRLGTRHYGPWKITFYRFPPHPSGGELGGHDLALAKMHGVTYFATVHGHTHRDADAAMLVAILLTAGRQRRGRATAATVHRQLSSRAATLAAKAGARALSPKRWKFVASGATQLPNAPGHPILGELSAFACPNTRADGGPRWMTPPLKITSKPTPTPSCAATWTRSSPTSPRG
jgi:hypothetical protein